MSIALATATIVLIGSGQTSHLEPWSDGNKMPGYKPAFTPSVLKGVTPKSVGIDQRSVFRGCRPIVSHYVVKASFAKTALSVLKEMKPDRGSNSIASRVLSDRVITASVTKGRPTVKRSGQNVSYDYSDQGTYTLITIRERPLITGPMPKAWPKAAMNTEKLPKAFPGHPFTGIERTPALWVKDMTPTGADFYQVVWLVKGKSETWQPKLLSQLQRNPKWGPPNPRESDNFRVHPADRKSGLGYLELDPANETFQESTGNWSRITLQWVDVSTVGGPRGTAPKRG